MDDLLFITSCCLHITQCARIYLFTPDSKTEFMFGFKQGLFSVLLPQFLLPFFPSLCPLELYALPNVIADRITLRLAGHKLFMMNHGILALILCSDSE